MENHRKNQHSRVAALDIDAPELKTILEMIACEVDDGYLKDDLKLIGKYFRDAWTVLGKHVHEHSASMLSDRGPALETNAEFDQFESLRADPDREELKKLRAKFHNVGAYSSHNRIATEQAIENALEAILKYIELWITKFAPDSERRPTAYKDPYLDKVAEYRKRAQARLTELMGDAPADCYLERKVRFRSLLNRDEPKPDEDPFSLNADTEEYDECEAALREMLDTFVPLKTNQRSLFLAQAGMGKSLEAAQLAVRLTCIDGIGPLACCVVLACRYLEKPALPDKGGFVPIRPGDNEEFCIFCALRGWKRYLILDGFDEIKKKIWTPEAFYQAVAGFQQAFPDVHVLITSRNITAVSSTFSSLWKAYELLELDVNSVADYMWARWKENTDLIRDVIQQWEVLDKHDNIRCLLMKPFFLCAFAETLNSGERISSMGRLRLVKGFIKELWARQRKKAGKTLTDEQWNAEILKLLSNLEEHAFRVVTGQDAHSTAEVNFLAGLDLLLEAKDKQFKQAEVGDYLAACYLFGKPNDENFSFLRKLEDEQRFTLHGWLLELVNAEKLDPENKTWVRNRLWQDDPVLVGLGLFSEAQLRALVLPARPWEPYEIGLLKIMRGEDVAAIPETSEIRDVRLSSPGEKLLHRLSQPDLPYLIRAVPDGRAVARLEAAWNGAADPWSEIMRPLAPITREWLENRRGLLPGSLDFAYGVLEPPATLEQSTTFANAIDGDDVEAEVLVKLMLSLKRLRARFGADREKIKGIDAAIGPLWPKVLDQSLSAKQLHRLLVHESQDMKAVSRVSQVHNLGPKIRRLVYQGEVGDAACLELVRMKPLIVEIRRLSCFGDGKEAQKFAVKLWDLWVASDVTSVPPFTLAQALRAQIATVESLTSDEWLAHWLAHWLERLNCYEAILLQERGVPFATTPPGFVDAQGWLQAREAVKLVYAQRKVLQGAVLPAHQYTPEQKRHWLATATMSELVGLLKNGVINRSATDDVFKQAVRLLEEDNHPQHWWQLVRDGRLTQDDIPYTLDKLKVQLKSKPIAYELLQSAKLYDEPPSEGVVDSTARCVDCPLDTRVHLVNSGKVSVEACWKAETDYLNEVRRKIAAGQPLQGIGDHDGPRQGSGLARGFYALIFRRGGAALNDIYFRHPAFDTAINFRNTRSRDEIMQTSRQWRDGELVMGFLWVDPDARSPNGTITVTQHRRHYAATGYVIRNGEPQFDPLVRDLKSHDE